MLEVGHRSDCFFHCRSAFVALLKSLRGASSCCWSGCIASAVNNRDSACVIPHCEVPRWESSCSGDDIKPCKCHPWCPQVLKYSHSCMHFWDVQRVTFKPVVFRILQTVCWGELLWIEMSTRGRLCRIQHSPVLVFFVSYEINPCGIFGCVFFHGGGRFQASWFKPRDTKPHAHTRHIHTIFVCRSLPNSCVKALY